MPQIGFVGLGKMGLPMAQRLVGAGMKPLVYDIAEAPLRAIEAEAAQSPQDLARRRDVIGVCVLSDAHVTTVCQALFETAKPGTVVAVHSTVRPATILALGEEATRRGLGLVDACISGGEAGAADGTLVFMVGGEPIHVDRCRPLFEATGKLTVHTGPLGSGTRMKLCNNAITYVTLRAVFESWQLAERAGLSGEQFEEITRASGVLSDRMQLYFRGLRMFANAEGVEDRLAHYTAVAEKDLLIALELAKELGVELPVTDLSLETIAEVYRTGRGSRG